ncbi:MAG: sugar transferase [Cyanobacteria bacterium P01_A01_bin.123]
MTNQQHSRSTIEPSRRWLSDIRAPRRLRLDHFLSWRWQRVLVLLLGDVLALAIAWQVARYLNQFYSPIPAQLVWWVWLGLPSLFWVLAVATLALFAQNGLYGTSIQVKNYLAAGQGVSIVYLSSLVLAYFYDPKLDPPRSLFFTAWFGSVALVILMRLLLNAVLKQIEQTHNQASVFLIAPAHRLKLLANTLQQRANYKIVGAALAAAAHTSTTLQAILDSKAKTVLIEDFPDADLASSFYWNLKRAGIALNLIPSSREMLYRRGAPEVFAGIPILSLEAPLLDGLDYHVKRWIDVVCAALGLLLLAPLFMVTAIAIRLSSPGPAFFRQERIGLHGKVFQVWKFRTMCADAPQLQAALEKQNQTQDGVLFKIKTDPRVTRVGRLLRRTSLDELPQLFNVVMGQMSLVGPRPLPLRDVAQFDPWHHTRHQVLPGITGLWQISGRSDIESFDDAARLDLHYIDNWSLNLDLEILMETIRIVLFGKGAY